MATFVKTIPSHKVQRQNSSLYVKSQLGRMLSEPLICYKRIAIICGPARLMEEKDIGAIMRVCVILHKIIVENERDNYELALAYDVMEGTTTVLIVSHEHHLCYETYFERSKEVHDPNTHTHLQENLIEEIWSLNLGRQQ